MAKEELEATMTWAAEAIASASALVVQGTLPAIWMAGEGSRSQAIELGYLFTNIGTDTDVLTTNQEAFAAGRRVEWKLR